jgi:hypothetical protein
MNLTLYKSVYGKLASLNSGRYAITRKHYFLGLSTGLLAIFFSLGVTSHSFVPFGLLRNIPCRYEGVPPFDIPFSAYL